MVRETIRQMQFAEWMEAFQLQKVAPHLFILLLTY